MRKIKLNELKDKMILDITDKTFSGYTTTTHTDINGLKYEKLEHEVKYIYLTDILDSRLYVTQSFLLDIMLEEYIEPIKNKEIYEHGYPEGRLTPSDHCEKCEDSYIEAIINDFKEKIEEILRDYI